MTIPRNTKPYGFTYEEWGSKWWLWLLSIPKSLNPAFDSTGVNANINQRSEVFFLCQSIEGVKPHPYRRVTIAKGRPILIPIINWLSTRNGDGETDEELVDSAKRRMDVISDLQFIVDDVPIKEGLLKYRAQSSVFEAVLPEDNILGIKEDTVRCFSDGYWIFLKPLERKTKISSFGSCSSGATQIGATYDIDVI